eukprot:TRINITY_DN32690_c0_g1_i1.p1 TRINITY_DN32690_c0_g1~~TRINITY_DN32690_c0_g1_i1.p1  ORF type:complete len:543 (+),score=130.34 TRINITY_DN32690_c0_g1_i1:49-1629(+)
MLQRATVKHWDDRGFGFVEVSDGQRAYVPAKILGHGEELDVGEVVQVVLEDDSVAPVNGKVAAREVWRKASKAGTMRGQEKSSAKRPELEPSAKKEAWPELPNSDDRVICTVQMWDNMQGFGSVLLPDERQAFVHITSIRQGALGEKPRGLGVGEMVSCCISSDHWQLVAFDVYPLLDEIDMSQDVGERVAGTVQEWNSRGFGFMGLPDGRRAYFHHSSVRHSANAGKKVNFSIGEHISAILTEDAQNPGKWAATDVVRIGSSSTRPSKKLAGPDEHVGAMVESWDERGFGFLLCADGRRAYVHASALSGEVTDLEKGDTVHARIVMDSKNPGKWAAADVRHGPVVMPARRTEMKAAEPINGVQLEIAEVTEWRDRGFGFVMTPDGKRAYVHHSTFGGGDLSIGEKVQVQIIPDKVNPSKNMVAALVRDQSKTSDDNFTWEKAKVHEWYEQRGFGFVELLDGSKRLYVHETIFRGGSLILGEEVEVVCAPDTIDPDKWRAKRVRGPGVKSLGQGDSEQDAKRQRTY